MNSPRVSARRASTPSRTRNVSRVQPTETSALLHDKARVLVVDDDRMNRKALALYLGKEGYVAETAENGQQALDLLSEASRGGSPQAFDLILLDLEMPGVDGIAVLERIQANDQWRQIPVIMISAVEEMGSVVRCIKLGAEDYFFKPFDPVLLRARISACLDRRAFYRALLETQDRLTRELAQAANYVRSLLPDPLTRGPVKADWRFIPSAQLGGDGFGYHWLDDDRLAMYLLDVSGHGVGAALLSVSAINILRGQSLPYTDFGDPSQVMAGLNKTFQMAEQGGMFFTVWYGIYQRGNRCLTWSSAGHPPAVLVLPQRDGEELASAEGLPVGVAVDATYDARSVGVPAGSRLYLFSDGVFEVATKEGRFWTLGELRSLLAQTADPARNEPGRVEHAIRRLAQAEAFEDDFSLLVFHFDQ